MLTPAVVWWAWDPAWLMGLMEPGEGPLRVPLIRNELSARTPGGSSLTRPSTLRARRRAEARREVHPRGREATRAGRRGGGVERVDAPAGRRLEHRLGHAAQQRPGDAPAAMRADDDEIGVERLRIADDLLGGRRC